ncbi:MAG: 5-formyltetrahydrofolate cyclo-ligase [Candidatus Burarchaeum sp.]|nr:5-formyltetrahydrofolate cyclo-ligase [Candidatus Burarchaeum sp.]MDO8340336.1 5-formyltetrahydrofolate cyclo-ligase [Candidatus Burarchaeum sp.]
MKKQMKSDMLAKRKSHACELVEKKSAAIMERLFALPEFRKAKTILFYAAKKDEVQTLEMIQKALDMGKTVALPITVVEGKNLVLAEVRNLSRLSEGAFGVLEPMDYVPVKPEEVDLVIVPGVAFDVHGDRLGHGMGYYDKLLKQMPDALFIGLAFEFQMVEDIPEEEHDVSVHKVVTEERVIGCGQDKTFC